MSQQEQAKIQMTLMLVGDCGVGKTAIVNRYVHGRFPQHPPKPATQGLDMEWKSIVVDDKNVNVCLIDTSGDERYRPILQSYYRPSDGHVIVYDVSDKRSFSNVNHWLEEIKQFDQRSARVEAMLVGNKSDKSRTVSYEEAAVYEQSKGINSYVETSAKDDHNVKKAINDLVIRLLLKAGHINDKTNKETTEPEKKKTNFCYCL